MPTEPPTTPTGHEILRIGISACLLGEPVRFDGGHKRDRFIQGTLGDHFEFVPVCPEVDIGLGTPRESLRLVRAGDGTRLVAPKSGADHTEAMLRCAALIRHYVRLREVRHLAGQRHLEPHPRELMLRNHV